MRSPEAAGKASQLGVDAGVFAGKTNGQGERGQRAWPMNANEWANGVNWWGQLVGDHKRRAVRTWIARHSTVQLTAGLRWTSVGPPGLAASVASERKLRPLLVSGGERLTKT